MQKFKDFLKKESIIKYLVKTAVYIVIFFIILYFMWQFLLDESLIDVLMQWH